MLGHPNTYIYRTYIVSLSSQETLNSFYLYLSIMTIGVYLFLDHLDANALFNLFIVLIRKISAKKKQKKQHIQVF